VGAARIFQAGVCPAPEKYAISQTESLAYNLALGFGVLGFEPYLVVFGHEAERGTDVVTRLAASLVVVAPVEPVGLDARGLCAEPRGEYDKKKKNNG
jgi:hypothetical protein